MMLRRCWFILDLVLLGLSSQLSRAFSPIQHPTTTTRNSHHSLRPYDSSTTTTTSTSLNIISDRSTFLLTLIMTTSSSTSFVGGLPSSIIVLATTKEEKDENNLTKQMFNDDGSLKAQVEIETKVRSVQGKWNPSERGAQNINGVNQAGTNVGTEIQWSYLLPEKWATGETGGDEIYLDRSEGVNAKACHQITVFQAPGLATMKQLEQATTNGIAKSLVVPSDLQQMLATADLISGRTNVRDGQKYFEFDMAVAPTSCDSSKEDLGLGFCPYNSVFLISATVLDNHLYALVIESDKDEWKRANSDLKRVRSSFTVATNR